MKKFLSVIFSVIFIFSAVSVSAFASNEPKAEDAVKNLDFEKGVGFLLSVPESNDFSDTVFYIKGEKMAMETSIEGIAVKLIVKDGTFYMYSPNLPFFYIRIDDAETSLLTENSDSFNIEADFIEFSEEEYNNKTYSVEVYEAADGGYIKYYFLDGELKFIKIIADADDEYSVMNVEIISTDVDDKVFNLPFLSFDVTPILELFIDFDEAF